MNLIDEAVIVEIFGLRVYAFGLYIAVGALFAVIVMCIAGRALALKKGTVPLAALLAGIFGIVVSRLCFCLLNQELGQMTPVSFWPQLSGGGWSMFGLIGGIMLGGFICVKIAHEKTGRVLDVLSLAMLPLIAAERIGESRIGDFDISRALDSEFLANSFLAVGEDEPCLATYYVAAAVAAVLFIVLAFRFARKERSGRLTVVFLLLFGAASIITESLRYDRFLSVSFVGLQQVAAALMLALGVILAIRSSNRPKSVPAILAIISLPLMVGAVIGLEFALDRTNWNKILIYTLMIITVGIPAGLGLKLLSQGKGTDEA
ncbi:MAG: prolipoprotein diacylglyceryl transferase [Clostridiales bacterium]|nr:prolipoprotein diacylglyceryl transferase [Clostridiales bacterium]